MRRRLTTLLLAVVTIVCGVVQAPAVASPDDDGILGGGAAAACRHGVVQFSEVISGDDLSDAQEDEFCARLGEAAERKMEEWWDAVWDSILGDIIKSASDAAKWALEMVLTAGLRGPSLDLRATGLFGEGATLYGMLVWLGLILSVFGMMWQIGRTALTGQAGHLGRAVLGWVENMLLSTVGVALFAMLLSISDAMTVGMIDAVFEEGGTANEQFAGVVAGAMVPAVHNPVTALCVVVALLLIGFVQMVLIFLRQSAIPLICLMLPIAGGGRVGGDATRQWAPRLITSGLVIVAYKPILAVIICAGFAGFGHAVSVVEWLRGLVTLVLAIIAPGPLFALFAPFGSAVGGGMAGGGARGALHAGATYLGGKFGGGGDDTADGAGSAGEGETTGGAGEGAGADAVSRSQYVEQVMPSQSQSPETGGAGADVQAQAARTAPHGASVPAQQGATGEAGATHAGGQTGAACITAAVGPGRAGAAAAAALQVLDGVNDVAHGASARIGGGNEQT